VLKGDAVHAVAQPFARGIDAVFGTNVAGCSSCKQMQANLNSGMSFSEALLQRFKRKEKMEFIVNRSIQIEANTPEEALEQTKPIGGISMAFNVNPKPQPIQRPVAPPQK
jgi:hypothetical protein